MRQAIATAALLFAATSCLGEVGTVSGLGTSDPLYDRVIEECGPDAIVMKVLDLENDEALCCYDYTNIVLKLHCMTASGASIADPNGMSKLQTLSKEAKGDPAIHLQQQAQQL